MTAGPGSRPVLVTGATGLVGSAVVRHLLADGVPVRVLRRASSRLDLLGATATHVEHAEGDVTDVEAVREAVRGVAAVFHVAGVVALGAAARARVWAVNARGTAHVVDAALAEGVRGFVHTSSIAALGRPETPGGVLDETAVWTRSRANTAYAESKRAGEREVLRGAAEGMHTVVVNPALVFGPGRTDEGTGALVERLRRGRVPAAPPGGTAVVDVEDVAAGLVAAWQRGRSGERYVLAGESLLWTDLLATLARALGVAAPTRVAPAWALWAAGALAEAAEALGGPVAGL
ncbi:MAG TPA: NAD-dependent epimerase/dehydratase family protein, partial [Rubricoccaceae bacterium]